ncbi:glycoside hydrolase family 3 N-terminal domain-containing protein [Paraoerskovia sediminicola]|nr:glycoside hydrolase family 3 N-terminal domain-containing protein [Paraoerskovia sediminicola]
MSTPDRTRHRRSGAAMLTVLLLAATTACSGAGDGEPAGSAAPSDPATVSPTASPSASATRTPTTTPAPGSDLSLEQKVGQVLMVGVQTDAPSDLSYAAVRDHHVGNVFLAGRSDAGVDAVADLVGTFTDLVGDDSTGGVPLYVATDQEGGAVQVLRGDGFSTIPSAVDQAAGTPAELESDATTWGAELSAAGINLNLAPVMDVVPEGTAKDNPRSATSGASTARRPRTSPRTRTRSPPGWRRAAST